MIGVELLILLHQTITPWVARCTPINISIDIELNRMLLLSILGPPISIVATYLYNAIPNSKNTNLHRAWSTDDFSSLIAYVTREILPIAITLENRKVYVGLVARSAEPQHDSAHITLLPLFSGHRDEHDLAMKLTNTYTEVFDVISDATETDVEIDIESLKNFYLIAPLDRIDIAHVFNYELYERISDQNLPPTTP